MVCVLQRSLALSEAAAEEEVVEEFLSKLEELTPMKLEDGDRLHVTVCHANTPSSFYIHAEDKKADVDTLLDEMFELYSNTEKELYKIHVPVEGSLVVAKFTEDSSWYRATILDVLDDDEIKVKFLDYGNVEICKLADLRKMLKKFGERPLFTVECTLGGVRAKDGPWSEEALEFFSEMTTDK